MSMTSKQPKRSEAMKEALSRVDDIANEFTKRNTKEVANMMGEALGIKVKIKGEKKKKGLFRK